MKFDKTSITTFLGMFVGTLITTIFTRWQAKADIQENVMLILEEERRQINALQNKKII